MDRTRLQQVGLTAFNDYVAQCEAQTDGGFDQFDIEMEVLAQLCRCRLDALQLPCHPCTFAARGF